MRHLFFDLEVRRMLILACVYAGIATLGYLRVIRPRAQRAAEFALAVTLLLLAWLQSFPAWNHSSQIGLYILFGTVALITACSASQPAARALGVTPSTQ
jgi:hypothetical protein